MNVHDHGLAVSLSNQVQAPQLELSLENLYQRATLFTPLKVSLAVAVAVNEVEVCQYGEIALTDEVGRVLSTPHIASAVPGVASSFPALSRALE